MRLIERGTKLRDRGAKLTDKDWAGGGEVGAGGSELDEHIKQSEAQVKTLTDKVNGEISRLVPPVWNPVREWKRKACEEVLGVVAPPGRAPLYQKPAVHSFDCFDPTCTYRRKKCRLDT